jgi:hypothetical protein
LTRFMSLLSLWEPAPSAPAGRSALADLESFWKRISLAHSCRDPAREIRGRRSEVRQCICNKLQLLIRKQIRLPPVAVRRQSRFLIADLRLLAASGGLQLPTQGRSDRLELAVARPRIGLIPRNRHFGGPWVPTPVRSLKTSNILPAGFEINVPTDRLFFSREAPLKNWRGSKKKFSQTRADSQHSHVPLNSDRLTTDIVRCNP